MTTGLALLLALRIATGQTPDGGAREVDQLSAASLVLVDGTHRDVDGGWYLPDTSMLATGQELAQLRTENATLKATPPDTQPASVVLAIAAFLVGAGLTAGLFVAAKH